MPEAKRQASAEGFQLAAWPQWCSVADPFGITATVGEAAGVLDESAIEAETCAGSAGVTMLCTACSVEVI